jgi:antitoxin HicB
VKAVSTFAYAACFEEGDDPAILIVTFRDVPEVVTEGEGMEEAVLHAREALEFALLTYPQRGLPLPQATPLQKSEIQIAVAPDMAAKLAVLEAFREAGLSKLELARLLHKDEREIRRILDPHHATKLASLSQALKVMGKKLVVTMEAA